MDITVSVEKASNILRKLTVKVPAKTVSNRFERGLVEVQRSAKIKGFRPGHVPISVVKQFYGEDVRHRVLHNLIDESYQFALQEQKIKAVGSPQIDTPNHKTGEGEHDHTLKENEDLTYTATVEVLPEIEAKGYTALPLSRGNDTVTDQDVESVVQGLLNSQAQLTPVTDSEYRAKNSNHVDIHFKGGLVTDTGIQEKQGMTGSRVLELGSDSLIPGFEENITGMKVGETKSFRIPFPKDFYDNELAGKDAEFTVTLNDIKEKILPTLDEDLAKQMGYESVEQLYEKAREHLKNQRTSEVDKKLRSDLLQQLIDKHSFEVPESLVRAQVRALMGELSSNLKNQGFNDKMIQEALMSELENLKKRAENQVRASLTLEAIAKKESISVSAEDIDAEIKTLSGQMKIEEANIREFYLKNPDRRDDLEFRLREDKTIKFLLEKSKIKQAK